MPGTTLKEKLIKDIVTLPEKQVKEVIDFIEFLKIKRLKRSGIDYYSLRIQQESIGRIWNNESEDLYEV